MSAVYSFENSVFQALAHIPKGRVVTYGQIAAFINRPRSSRAVGNVLNKNPHVGTVPCHRVVRSDGDVGGYVHGQKEKIELLRSEDVVIEDAWIDLDIYGFTFLK